jgi:uncharacterized protein YjiS (DUF1127 family)
MRATTFVPLRMARSLELGSVLGNRTKAAWQRYRVWRHRRATARALEGLSDRTLKDIGLDRSERLARGGSACSRIGSAFPALTMGRDNQCRQAL